VAHITKIPDHNKYDPLNTKAEHAPAKEKPVTANSAFAAYHKKDPRVTIQIYKRQNGSYWARCALYSHMKPNNLVEAPVEFTGKSMSDIEFEIGVAFGAMAERLFALHNDNFDTEVCAREGAKKFNEVIREMERQR
jgi:hypothetical protein